VTIARNYYKRLKKTVDILLKRVILYTTLSNKANIMNRATELIVSFHSMKSLAEYTVTLEEELARIKEMIEEETIKEQ
jgi:hypothetical protein